MTIKIMKRAVSGSIISNYGRFLVAFSDVSGSIPLCFSNLMVHIGRLAGGADPSGGLGWSGPILLPRNYPGTTRDLDWLRWGGLAESAGKEFGRLAKNIAAD